MIDELVAAAERGQAFCELDMPAGWAPTSEEVDAFASEIERRRDASAYHLLLTLADRAPQAVAHIDPAARAGVLSSALADLHWLNDWGHPGPDPSEGPAARALLACGEVAREFLKPLLDDTRPARLFGSEPGALADGYGYRRCDYAYRYLALLQSREPEWHDEPSARDGALERARRKA